MKILLEKLKGGEINSLKEREINSLKGGKGEVRCGEHNKDIYCKCEENTENDDMMVGCDCCENWFHPSCIKKKEKQVESMDSFFCEFCLDWDQLKRGKYLVGGGLK